MSASAGQPFKHPNPAHKGVRVSRLQLPLIMTPGATPFTAQGMTADWALLHLDPHKQMTIHQWWCQVYVAMSRARNAVRLAHHGKTPDGLQKLLAVGPEAHIRAELARLKDLDIKTRPKSAAAARVMGWPAAGAELSAWRREERPRVEEHPGWGAAYDGGTKDPLPPAAPERDAAAAPAAGPPATPPHAPAAAAAAAGPPAQPPAPPSAAGPAPAPPRRVPAPRYPKRINFGAY